MKDIPPVGTVNPDWDGRDAIHVAVVTALAESRLFPGQRVSKDGRCGTADAVGIVDPYLTVPVETGQRFFIFLFPGTVTSLRHVWTHPTFEECGK